MSTPPQLTLAVMLITLTSSIYGCSSTKSSPPVRQPSTPQNIFDAYIQSDYPPADGFDFPVGNTNAKGAYVDAATGKSFDGWYVATQFNEEYNLGVHTGEDWNGSGGGNTDLGQDVYAVAHGRVTL